MQSVSQLATEQSQEKLWLGEDPKKYPICNHPIGNIHSKQPEGYKKPGEGALDKGL